MSNRNVYDGCPLVGMFTLLSVKDTVGMIYSCWVHACSTRMLVTTYCNGVDLENLASSSERDIATDLSTLASGVVVAFRDNGVDVSTSL